MADGAARAPRTSAGILLWRRVARPEGGSDDGGGGLEVLLGHMGGPFWARKDERAWSIPKGEPEPGEDLLDAARREFVEELGLPVPDGPLVELGSARQSSGKVVSAWALEADLDPAAVVPGRFTMEWPPRSGRTQEFPEIDRVEWMSLEVARRRVVTGQVSLLDRLVEISTP